MKKTILWLDNDPPLISAFSAMLTKNGYDVTLALSVTDAEQSIASKRFDLLILDVMIPTRTNEEEERFPPDETSTGMHTGYVFYKRYRDQLVKAQTKVLVMTMQLEPKIKQSFLNAGLPEKYYFNRITLSDVNVLLTTVNEMFKT